MPRYTGFIGPWAVTPSIVAGADQTVNWIPAKIESGTGAGDAQYVFDPAPGLSYIGASVGSGTFRARAALDRVAYYVLGTALVSVTNVPTGPSWSTLGTVGGSGGNPTIAPGGFANNQVLATNGNGDLFVFNTQTLAFTQVLTVNGNTVVFINGYFLLLDESTSIVHFSSLEDGTTWDPADEFQREDVGDFWKTMIVKQNEVWLFGSQSTSVYFPVDDDPPFAPNLNVTVTRGIRAVKSLQLMQGSPIWLADDGTVRYAQGYNPVRISTHAIEHVWAGYSTTTDAEGSVYSEQGHTLYVLTFPTGNQSWAYDLITGLWTQVGAYNTGTGEFDALAVSNGVQIPDETATGISAPYLMASRTDNKVYYYSQAHSTEIDGTTGLTYRRRAPNLVEELQQVVHHWFRLFMEVGTGPSNPTLTLKWSNDGGQTFNAGVTASAGGTGAYNTLVRWRKLGLARNRVYQVQCTTAQPLRLVDAFIDPQVGAS
jgi:hypothetical protein